MSDLNVLQLVFGHSRTLSFNFLTYITSLQKLQDQSWIVAFIVKINLNFEIQGP